MVFIFRRKQEKANLNQLADNDLISYFRKERDQEVIGILFTRDTHLVYGVCLNLIRDEDDAKDAVMEIFEGLIDDLASYEIQNFKSWLHSVTRNHCLMKLRRSKMMRMEPEMIAEKQEGIFVENEDEMHPDIESEADRKKLASAMEYLKEPQRKCIELVYLESKSYIEVSEITGYTMKEVKSHVQNGKRNLRIRLESRNVGKS